MTITEQNQIIRECMHHWPKTEVFPIFEPDLNNWFARSNDVHRRLLGSGVPILDALLSAALKGKRDETNPGQQGDYDLAITLLRQSLTRRHAFEQTPQY